jgi:hypothetical protein
VTGKPPPGPDVWALARFALLAALLLYLFAAYPVVGVALVYVLAAVEGSL